MQIKKSLYIYNIILFLFATCIYNPILMQLEVTVWFVEYCSMLLI